jgi:hypothetical protein
MAAGFKEPGRAVLPQSVEGVFNAVLLAIMAGRRAMAVIAEDGADASALVTRVALQMKATGTLTLMATAAPGVTLKELLGQETGRPVDVRDLTRNLDEPKAGLIAVADAGALDPPVLAALLRLASTETGNGCFFQVLLAGDAVLDIRLDGPHIAPFVQRFGAPRWLVPSTEASRAVIPAMPEPLPPAPRRSPVWLPLAGLLVVFLISTAAGALWLPAPVPPTVSQPAPVPLAEEPPTAADAVMPAPAPQPVPASLHMPIPLVSPPSNNLGRAEPQAPPAAGRPHRPIGQARRMAEVQKPEASGCRGVGGPRARVASVSDFFSSFAGDIKGLGQCIGGLIEPARPRQTR